MTNIKLPCTNFGLKVHNCCVFVFSVAGLGSNRCSNTEPNVLQAGPNMISSHVTDETGCGSARSPWLIQAKAGQTIEISLVDFKALDRARSQSLVTCSDVYGFVVEKTLNINQTICGNKQRDSVVYRLKTNNVEIYVKKDTGANFVIKYTSEWCK